MSMSAAVAAELPPLVVGAELKPFLLVGGPRREFFCPIHTPRVEWPTRAEPVWRGEVPEDAACETCGIELADLE